MPNDSFLTFLLFSLCLVVRGTHLPLTSFKNFCIQMVLVDLSLVVRDTHLPLTSFKSLCLQMVLMDSSFSLFPDPEVLSPITLYTLFFSIFFGNSTACIFGKTPPWAIVTPLRSLFNSSSFLMANCKCLGTILVFLLSLAALPAYSKTSAAKYSKTAAR